jgi:hypothetical protein
MNFEGMLRAPSYDWEVTMDRNRSSNEQQNSRKRIAYVKAPNADDAKREAKKKHPAFFPTSARKVS